MAHQEEGHVSGSSGSDDYRHHYESPQQADNLIGAPSSSSSYSSPYRNQRTRRERLDKQKEKSRRLTTRSNENNQQEHQQYESFRPAQQFQHHHDDDDEEEKKSDSSLPSRRPIAIENENDGVSSSQDYADVIRQPLHLTPPEKLGTTSDDDNDNYRYYRIVYRGVVALLSQPDHGSARSGCYLSYGEVIKSGCQIPLKQYPNGDKDNNSPPEIAAIRVDEVLTGGYAFDPPDPSNIAAGSHSETPKRSNVQGYTTTTGGGAAASMSGQAPSSADASASPPTPAVTIAISHSSSSDDDETLDVSQLEATSDSIRCEHNGVSHQGFVFSHNKTNMAIVELLQKPPKCEHGRFFYKIVSPTPLPIMSGPSTDAPLSKAMVLPGTVHEVSFRMKLSENDDDDDNDVDADDEIWFLRLARRKGYLASRRIGRKQRSRREGARASPQSELLVKDVTEEIHSSGIEQSSNSCNTAAAGEDDGTANVSILSVLSTSVPASTARNPNRRHRPPRRQRETAKADRRPMHHHTIGGISAVTARSRAQHNNNHNDSAFTSLSAPSHSSDRLQTPSSNVSLLSDDSCLMMDPHQQHASFSSNENNHNHPRISGALSPDRSVARSIKSNHSFQQPQQHATFYLMRVLAPRGLRILDAPHFQVNNLIHGTQQQQQHPQPMGVASNISGLQSTTGQHHLFRTMADRIAPSKPAENTVVFDSVTKTRILPRGAVFEASKRMETSDALFHQGAGLIKLADNSGWVIVPHREELEHQYRSNGTKDGSGGHRHVRAFEEIGNAILFADDVTDLWMRIVARAGAHVVCAPPPPQLHKDNTSSPTSASSPVSSPVSSNMNSPAQPEQLDASRSDSASDVASSVGSSFLDAMFRVPKRTDASEQTKASDKGRDPAGALGASAEKLLFTSTTIPCGMCVQVEPQIPSEQHQSAPQEYARLRGGQGWMPLFAGGKPTCVVCPRRKPPTYRLGSFWFRVQSKRGIKVRLGPSKRAPSIKSNDGVDFRFECGEFLRASEVVTVYYDDTHGRTLSESFAKLYRNRHVRLNAAKGDGQSAHRHLASLTAQAEWVQIHDDDKNEQFLQECTTGPPRIERHKQGWRYKVVAGSGLPIRKGPSFDAEVSGIYVSEGESVVIIERVTSSEENDVTWLRLKEGQGWLHDVERDTGERLLIPHSFRHQTKATNTRPVKPRRREAHDDDKQKQIAYNTIIARLFHNDLLDDHHPG